MPCLVVIPALNVAATIGPLVSQIRQQGHEVLVIDDGSSDATGATAAAAGARVLHHVTTRGKGASLRTGFAEALRRQAECVVTFDADGQHDPADIPRLVQYAVEHPEASVIIGNRMGQAQRMPRVRRWTNRLMSWLLSRLAGQHVPDTQCGLRLMRTALLRHLTLTTSHYEIESELVLAAARAGAAMHPISIQPIYGSSPSGIRPALDTVRFIRLVLRFVCARSTPSAHR